MTRNRNRQSPRRTHTAARRNEWFGIVYVAPEIVTLARDVAREIMPGEHVTDRTAVDLLQPVYDAHYEASWPDAGGVPYTSVYETGRRGEPVYIELRTWPGERTEVNRCADSPAQRRTRLDPDLLVANE